MHHFPDIIMLLIISSIAILQVMAATDYSQNDGYCFMCITHFYNYDYKDYFQQMETSKITDLFGVPEFELPYFCTLDFKCRDRKLTNYNCETGLKACLLFTNFTETVPDLVVDDAQSVVD